MPLSETGTGTKMFGYRHDEGEVWPWEGVVKALLLGRGGDTRKRETVMQSSREKAGIRSRETERRDKRKRGPQITSGRRFLKRSRDSRVLSSSCFGWAGGG